METAHERTSLCWLLFRKIWCNIRDCRSQFLLSPKASCWQWTRGEVARNQRIAWIDLNNNCINMQIFFLFFISSSSKSFHRDYNLDNGTEMEWTFSMFNVWRNWMPTHRRCRQKKQRLEFKWRERGSENLTHCVIKAEHSGIPFSFITLCVWVKSAQFHRRCIQISLNCRNFHFTFYSVYLFLEKLQAFNLLHFPFGAERARFEASKLGIISSGHFCINVM